MGPSIKLLLICGLLFFIVGDFAVGQRLQSSCVQTMFGVRCPPRRGVMGRQRFTFCGGLYDRCIPSDYGNPQATCCDGQACYDTPDGYFCGSASRGLYGRQSPFKCQIMYGDCDYVSLSKRCCAGMVCAFTPAGQICVDDRGNPAVYDR